MDFAAEHNGTSQVLLDERLCSEELASKGSVYDILAQLQRLYDADSVAGLCEARRQPADREFIASSLVRIYRLRGDALKGSVLHVARLCENTYYPRPRDFDTMTEKQPFEKVALYARFLEQAMRNASELDFFFGPLDQFHDARGAFLKNLSSDESRAFVLPFVAPELRAPSTFTFLFNSIQSYVRSEGLQKYHSFLLVDNAFGDIDAQQQSSTWRLTYGKALAKLRSSIAADYRSSDIYKPATLKLSPVSRKYPLHIGEREFSIGFLIENEGPGIALAVELELVSNLQRPHSVHHLARVDPGVTPASVPAIVDRGGNHEVHCTATLRWTSPSSSEKMSTDCTFSLDPQNSNVDWSTVFPVQRYPIGPVTDEEKLIGRHDLLRNLTTQFSYGEVPSYMVYGQRRVGKTSVVRSLENALLKREAAYKIVYIEVGEFITDQTETSLSHMGSALATRLLKLLPDFTDPPAVSFEDSIAPLGNILDAYLTSHPGVRFLFIIDEFDALPVDLYRRGPIGDTLFLNFRSLTLKPNVGFILVGSENMAQVINQQGMQINRWDNLELDYFDHDKDWQDFIALVRRPAEGILDYASEAIDTLYEYSAGNPYFTNLICRRVLELAAKARESFVSTREIEDAVLVAANSEPLSRFAHFWDDGILETDEPKEAVSLRRRTVLYAIADLMEQQVARPREAIQTHWALHGISSEVVLNEIREFERRGILLHHQTELRFKVGLFGEWLRRYGKQHMTLQNHAKASPAFARARRERATVRLEEIEAVTGGWIYHGRSVGPDQVRAWLNQFSAPGEQRIAFEAISAFQFYTKPRILAEMRSTFDRLRREFQTDDTRRHERRREFVVTQLDHTGRGAKLMARYFAEANDLPETSAVPMVDLGNTLARSTEARVIVALADFIGTGESLRKAIKRLWEDCGPIVSSRGLALCVVILVGFEEAARGLRVFCDSHGIRAEIEVRDALDDSHKAFSAVSTVYPDPVRRRAAERMFRKYGELLNARWPLGFGDSQTLITFEHNVPNDTLPVFWENSRLWRALFPRH